MPQKKQTMNTTVKQSTKVSKDAKVQTTTKVVSEAKAAKAAKVKKVKVEPKVSFNDQLEGNILFKNERNLECKKLGFALGLLEKHIECFHPLIRDYIRSIRNEKHLYLLAETMCKKSKSGNFTPWLLQSYIRNKVNNA
jgi:hypothetical protein